MATLRLWVGRRAQPPPSHELLREVLWHLPMRNNVDSLHARPLTSTETFALRSGRARTTSPPQRPVTTASCVLRIGRYSRCSRPTKQQTSGVTSSRRQCNKVAAGGRLVGVRRLIAAVCSALTLTAACTSTGVDHSTAPSPSSGAVTSSALTPTTASNPSSSPAASTTPAQSSTHPVAAGIKVAPWDGVTVGGSAGHARPLAGDVHSLFALDGNRIMRLDATTGAVVASRQYPKEIDWPALVLGHTLWVSPMVVAGVLTVPGFDTATLAPRTPIAIHEAGVKLATTTGTAIAADRVHKRLYVGAGRYVSIVDPATRRTVTVFREPVRRGDIVSLALSPDATRLYLTYFATARQRSSIVTLDARSGEELDPPVDFDGGTGADGISASSGGIWLRTGIGMTDMLAFYPVSDLARTASHFVLGGAGYPVTATPTQATVWEGGVERHRLRRPRDWRSAGNGADAVARRQRGEHRVSHRRRRPAVRLLPSRQRAVPRAHPTAPTGNVPVRRYWRG